MTSATPRWGETSRTAGMRRTACLAPLDGSGSGATDADVIIGTSLAKLIDIDPMRARRSEADRGHL